MAGFGAFSKSCFLTTVPISTCYMRQEMILFNFVGMACKPNVPFAEGDDFAEGFFS